MKPEGKSELFHLLSRATLPTREGHDFQCEECRKTFVVPFDEYHGQFDHPPSVPICDECAELLN